MVRARQDTVLRGGDSRTSGVCGTPSRPLGACVVLPCMHACRPVLRAAGDAQRAGWNRLVPAGRVRHQTVGVLSPELQARSELQSDALLHAKLWMVIACANVGILPPGLCAVFDSCWLWLWGWAPAKGMPLTTVYFCFAPLRLCIPLFTWDLDLARLSFHNIGSLMYCWVCSLAV